MPAVTVAFRLSPGDLCGGALPFQDHQEARVDRPLDDIDLTELFQNVQGSPVPNQGNLRVGDEVTICAYRDRTWSQLMEVGVVRICAKRDGKVYAVWVGEMFKVPDQQVIKPVVKTQVLNIKKEFGGGFTVRDDKNHIIESFKTKDEARYYIERLDNPFATPPETKVA